MRTRFMASQVPIMEMASDKLLHSLATPDVLEIVVHELGIYA